MHPRNHKRSMGPGAFPDYPCGPMFSLARRLSPTAIVAGPFGFGATPPANRPKARAPLLQPVVATCLIDPRLLARTNARPPKGARTLHRPPLRPRLPPCAPPFAYHHCCGAHLVLGARLQRTDRRRGRPCWNPLSRSLSLASRNLPRTKLHALNGLRILPQPPLRPPVFVGAPPFAYHHCCGPIWFRGHASSKQTEGAGAPAGPRCRDIVHWAPATCFRGISQKLEHRVGPDPRADHPCGPRFRLTRRTPPTTFGRAPSGARYGRRRI